VGEPRFAALREHLSEQRRDGSYATEPSLEFYFALEQSESVGGAGVVDEVPESPSYLSVGVLREMPRRVSEQDPEKADAGGGFRLSQIGVGIAVPFRPLARVVEDPTHPCHHVGIVDACQNPDLPPPNGPSAQLRAALEREGYIRRVAGESTAPPAARRLEVSRRPSRAGASAAAPCWAAGEFLAWRRHRKTGSEVHVAELSDRQRAMVEMWENHLTYEFETHDADATVSTMVDDAYVNHVPTMTGGRGLEGLRQFYGRHFVSKLPTDFASNLISRTIDDDQLVDELFTEFTHSVEMDFLLPGVPPTGRRVAVGIVVVARFRDGKLAHEHIYWDQASVLVQLGLLDEDALPVVGRRSADKLLDESIAFNELIGR
jgi:carboxymethylenebutenolidase